MEEPSERYVDDRVAADILGLSRSYLRALRVRGGGPRFSALAPKAIRYRVSELMRWAEGRTRASTSGVGERLDGQ
jgi:hypothetical protein